MSGGSGAKPDLEIAIDRLYQGALPAFIAARNQLARALRPRDRGAADDVAKLAKPSVTAWAVNQAYWNAPADFEALLDAGEQIRGLQRQALEGGPAGDMQAAMSERMRCMARVMIHAERALREGGHATNPGILRRITTTLEALAAYGRVASAPTPGRLAADIPAAGFAALAALAGEVPTPRAARAGAAASRRGEAGAGSKREASPDGGDDGDDGDGEDGRDGNDRAAPRLPNGRRATANDNATGPHGDGEAGGGRGDIAGGPRVAAARATRNRAAALVEARHERRRAHAAVAETEAALADKRREVTAAERATQDALERVYSAEKQVALAQEVLASAITERGEAVAGAEAAKRELARVRDSITEAEAAAAEARRKLDELS